MIKKKLGLVLATTLLSFSLIGTTNVSAKTKTNNQKANYSVQKSNDGEQPKKNKAKLTVMMYMDGDNDLEWSMLNDIEEMKKGYVDNPDLNLIVLIDRAPGYTNNSETLGENFEDTRMYKIEHNKAIRISGGKEFSAITTDGTFECNMGDPTTLKKFINSCKANYSADKYMLVLSNHGGGAKDRRDRVSLDKEICWDDTSYGDCLYMGEISDVLTKEQSVDVLAFDACLMGTAEVAYQFRPGNGGFQADVMVASSPTLWSNGFQYDKIFERLKAGGGTNHELDLTLGDRESFFDPATVTNEQLGALLVEEQRDSTDRARITSQQLSCYDLSKAKAVKDSVDALARNLSERKKKKVIEKIRGSFDNINLIHYFNGKKESDWVGNAYFDLYDLCEKISISDKCGKVTKKLARNVMKNVDDMVLYSFAGRYFFGFKEGKHGVSIFLPDGNRPFGDGNALFGPPIPHWQIQRWYNPNNTNVQGLNFYGNLAWCRDNLDSKVNSVGNWFELLDSWFDTSNDEIGGYNHYQW